MPTAPQTDVRPPVTPSMCAAEFARWYWPVDQLKAFCEALNLPKSGTKAELRARVAFALVHPGKPQPRAAVGRKPAAFNWAKATLTTDTLITPDVSFGPNVRGFFKAQIGKNFVCHSDFMDWMRSNTGATLGDAIQAWQTLEARKDDPDFRREIASCNNYLQYLRDARDQCPQLSLDAAKLCWDYKKVRPAVDGVVVFEMRDVVDAGAE